MLYTILRCRHLMMLFGSFTLVACSESGHLTKRYKEVNYDNNLSENELKKVVEVDGFVFDPEPKTTANKGFFDMSPQGQKAFIKALSDKAAKTDDLARTLGSPLKKDDNHFIVDHSKFTKRLVFTVIDHSANQADRITKANIVVTVPDKILKVRSFDKIVTRYASVDIGQLNFSNATNWGVSANAGAGADVGDTSSTASTPASAGFGYGVNASASGSRQFSELVNLNQRYVALTGYVTPTTLNLYEESINGVDLTGNIVAEATFEFIGGNRSMRATYSFDNLYKKDTALVPGKIKVAEVYQRYPAIDADVYVTFTYSATLRQVMDGDKTVSESDDKIKLVSGSAPTGQNILLAPMKELLPKFWMIKANTRVLQIKGPLADDYGILFFASIEDAQAFLIWLRKEGAQVINAGGKLADDQYSLQLDNGSAINNAFVTNCVIEETDKH